MTTHILDLPKRSLDAEVATNEDWLSVVSFDDGGDPATPYALDGIAFAMELRVAAADSTVWLAASISAGDLIIGTGLNTLKWNVPASRMKTLPAQPYVFDVVATADWHSRVVVSGTLTVTTGITR